MEIAITSKMRNGKRGLDYKVQVNEDTIWIHEVHNVELIIDKSGFEGVLDNFMKYVDYLFQSEVITLNHLKVLVNNKAAIQEAIECIYVSERQATLALTNRKLNIQLDDVKESK